MNIEQAVLENLRKLSLEKQQEVLNFSQALTKNTLLPSPDPNLTPQQKAEKWVKFVESLSSDNPPLPQASTRTEINKKKEHAFFGSSLKNATLWDWFQLLFIPAFVAVVAFKIQDISSREAKQQEVIKSYLKDMTDIMKEPETQLTKSRRTKIAENKWEYHYNLIQDLVGTRTKLALQELEPKQKTQIMTFISDAGLQDKIRLNQANLEGADLQYLYLKNASLQKANLKNANLSGAILEGTNLKYVNDEKTQFNNATWNECTRFSKEFDPKLKKKMKKVTRTQKEIKVEGKECRYPEK